MQMLVKSEDQVCDRLCPIVRTLRAPWHELRSRWYLTEVRCSVSGLAGWYSRVAFLVNEATPLEKASCSTADQLVPNFLHTTMTQEMQKQKRRLAALAPPAKRARQDGVVMDGVSGGRVGGGELVRLRFAARRGQCAFAGVIAPDDARKVEYTRQQVAALEDPFVEAPPVPAPIRRVRTW